MSKPKTATASDVRQLLRPDVEFVPGKYPDRPAPAHVVNNFIHRANGGSPGGDLVVRFATSGDRAGNLRGHPLLASEDWDPSQLESLGADLRVIFDPDRRMFPSQGAPFPIDWRLASRTPADDGLGDALWRSIPETRRPDISLRLRSLLDGSEEDDPGSLAARFVLAALPQGADGSETQAEADATDSSPAAAEGTSESPDRPARSLFGSHLADLLEHALVDGARGARLEAIRDLDTLLYFATLLGLLVESSPPSSATPEDLTDLLGILVFTGHPPGERDDPLVRAAQLSFKFAAARAHEGLAAALLRAVEHSLDESVPRDVRLETAILARTVGLKGQESLVRRLRTSAPFASPDGTALEPSEWVGNLMHATYPIEHLTRAIRSMGVKVGFVGPVRGFGKPRFILETPLLATITKVLVAPEQSITFGEFIRRSRQRLGLVLGGDGLASLPDATIRAFSSQDMARHQLAESENRLRRRMIEAGLAREFSDAHTVVIGR